MVRITDPHGIFKTKDNGHNLLLVGVVILEPKNIRTYDLRSYSEQHIIDNLLQSMPESIT